MRSQRLVLVCVGLLSARLIACGSNSDGIPAGPVVADGGDNEAARAADGAATVGPDGDLVNSVLCPTSEPTPGTSCPSVGLACRYPSSCAVPKVATCSAGGTWGSSLPDCALHCPSSLPESGADCAVPRLECEYGADPRPGCRERAVCTESGSPSPTTKKWATTKPTCAAQKTCPAGAPSSGDACTEMAGAHGGAFFDVAVCAYPATACGCYDTLAGCGACEGSNFRWRCTAIPAAPCPPIRANLGAACPQEGLTCDYGTCDKGTFERVACSDGAWLRQPNTCR